MTTSLVQYALFYSDIIFMCICLLAILKSFSRKCWPIFTLSLVFLVAVACRHIIQGSYSKLPRFEKVELYYQTFEYTYVLVILLSVILHAVFLWKTTRIVRGIYALLAVNICCYVFMHWQRNVYNLNEPNWTWDVYTWTVVPINYVIAGLLVYASTQGVKQVYGNSIN